MTLRLEVGTKYARYLASVEYFGSSFNGFSQTRIPGRTGVADVLENSFKNMCYGKDAKLSCSSRTDTGVHGLFNTFHIDLPIKEGKPGYSPINLINAANSAIRKQNYGQDLSIINMINVPSEKVHSRFTASSREYVYQISVNEKNKIFQNNKFWQVKESFDLDLFHEAMTSFQGQHDFFHFTTPSSALESRTFRTIDHTSVEKISSTNQIPSISFDKSSIMINVHIKSRGFLYHQVRYMVGTAMDVATGTITMKDFQALLARKTHDIPSSKLVNRTLAPPQGLYLSRVNYPQPYHDLLYNHPPSTDPPCHTYVYSEEDRLTFYPYAQGEAGKKTK